MAILNDKIQLDENVLALISKLENDLNAKGEDLKSKDKEIDSLKNRIEVLEALILNKNKKIFGQSTEKLDCRQMSIFNEAETTFDPKEPEPTTETISYERKKPSKNKGKKDNFKNLEVVVIEHKLDDENKNCNICDSELSEVGTSTKDIIKFIPARAYIERHVSYSYECRPCNENTDKKIITTEKAPETLLYKSMCSNDLLSHVLCLKFLYALPLHRQETYFEMAGVTLSRQTLSNWVIYAANELTAVYNIMKEELLKNDYIQADETTLRVIDSKGDESRTKHYMWVYRTGEDISPIILYDYQETRSSSCPKKFLEGFAGCLQTDGYTGYNRVENIFRLYCLAHIRRKFYEIVITLKGDALKESLSVKGFNYCEKLYAIEKQLKKDHISKDDFYEIRYETRLEKSAPVINEFIAFVYDSIDITLPQSPVGKALAYAKKLLPHMKNLLLDGRYEIDNNASERAVKNFVIGRKNWLFSNSKQGASSSATIYSIIETAKANKLKVENYLIYLMNNLCKGDRQDKSLILDLLPCSTKIPNELKIDPSN